jgi:Uma2 family endonuclease
MTLTPPGTTVVPSEAGKPVLPLASPYTIADWGLFEADKERKHQLRNGEFLEMAGASYEHNVIAGNLFGELYAVLHDTDCQVLGSDQKVYIDNDNGLYPDLVIVCGEPLLHPVEALQNPVLIVEVLSPATAADDRGEKFEKYRTRPTLTHYILVEQSRPSVEHFERGESGHWTLVSEHHALTDTLSLTLGGATLTLPLAAIYRRVTFALQG